MVEQVKSDRNNSGANGSQSSVCLCNNSSMPLVLKSTSVSTFPMVVMLSGFLIPECRETASTTSETAVSVAIALGVGTLFKSYRRWTSWQEKSRSFEKDSPTEACGQQITKIVFTRRTLYSLTAFDRRSPKKSLQLVLRSPFFGFCSTHNLPLSESADQINSKVPTRKIFA